MHGGRHLGVDPNKSPTKFPEPMSGAAGTVKRRRIRRRAGEVTYVDCRLLSCIVHCLVGGGGGTYVGSLSTECATCT